MWRRVGREGMAVNEIAELVTAATPYMTTAVSAYGGAVLGKVRDDAADVTVGVGRRILQRVFGRRGDGEPLPEALTAVVDNLGDADALGMLRMAMRQALAADAAMLDEVKQILAAAPSSSVTQHVHAGRDAYVAGHDMTITRPAD
jgi:hypothetical protein